MQVNERRRGQSVSSFRLSSSVPAPVTSAVSGSPQTRRRTNGVNESIRRRPGGGTGGRFETSGCFPVDCPPSPAGRAVPHPAARRANTVAPAPQETVKVGARFCESSEPQTRVLPVQGGLGASIRGSPGLFRPPCAMTLYELEIGGVSSRPGSKIDGLSIFSSEHARQWLQDSLATGEAGSPSFGWSSPAPGP